MLHANRGTPRIQGDLARGAPAKLPTIALIDTVSFTRAPEHSLAVIPNISRELPIVSDLFPHNNILPGNFLRRWTLGFQTEGADFARRR